jgi:hypothetical protein
MSEPEGPLEAPRRRVGDTAERETTAVADIAVQTPRHGI